ncbi:MAG: D-aminoacyl-tRNA deacylase [bacterium JZ-2024 1]
MRCVVQRVSRACVRVEGKLFASIGSGLVVFLSFENGDSEEALEYMKKKILQLRIFSDEQGKMNRSVVEENKEILLVPNFTVSGDARYGNRPDFTSSASFEQAEKMFHHFAQHLERDYPGKIKKGSFGSYMEVEVVNDGPVTILLDSSRRF